jgi:hypothetical protein
LTIKVTGIEVSLRRLDCQVCGDDFKEEGWQRRETSAVFVADMKNRGLTWFNQFKGGEPCG